MITLEAGRPVPNAVVAAFDADEPFVANAPEWESLERLGSAATDESGLFELVYDRSMFEGDEEPEARPDLIIALFGPHLVGLNSDPDERPFFWTSTPRAEAGNREAYVIAVPADLLAEAGLPVGSGIATAPESEGSDGLALRQANERSRRFSRSIGRGIAPELTRLLKGRERGSQLVRKLLGAPRVAQDERALFVLPGATPQAALERSRASGLEKLAGGASEMQGMTFGGTQQAYEGLGLALEPDGSVTIPSGAGLTWDEHFKYQQPLFTAAVRARAHLDGCKDAQRQKELEEAASPDGGGANPDPIGVEDLASPDIDLARLAGELLAGLGADTTHPVGKRPDPSTICSDVEGTLCGGPADEPSYHDFHSVQVAWQDVWTAIIDERSRDELTKVYESIVEVVEWSNVSEYLGEAADLEEFLRRLGDTVDVAAVAAGAGGTLPKELVDWTTNASDGRTPLTDLEEKWPGLSSAHQEYLLFLRWTEDKWKEKKALWPMGVPKESVPSQSMKPDHTITLWSVLGEDGGYPTEWLEAEPFSTFHWGWGQRRARAILDGYPLPTKGDSTKSWVPQLARAQRLMKGIRSRLAEPYRFDVFHPASYNFGIVSTFRQKWQPLGYQVGELVATIPLAPGEKRKYSKKSSVKTTRAQKEVEKWMNSRQGESTETARAEAEIVRRAKSTTNFTLSAEGGFDVDIAYANVHGQFTADQRQASAATKKDFREQVLKTALKYRNERSLTVETGLETLDEFSETGEIHNPNDELTVTYLLYELQRRVEISERLHRVTPVVLCPFRVPAPHEIDEDWLLAHEWILQRVILDDGFLPALSYLADTFAGDELSVEVHRVQWETQVAVVRDLGSNLDVRETLRRQARSALRSALQRTATGSGGGVLDTVGDILFGDRDADESAAAEARRQSAQHALSWEEADFSRAEQELSGAIATLHVATEAYSDALRNRLNRRVAIDQLRIHVKANILYYMKAIWLHEPPDQRYFRIYDKEVGWPAGGSIKPINKIERSSSQKDIQAVIDALINAPDSTTNTIETNFHIPAPNWGVETRTLHEVADIDRLLGFKGNYAIFPLKEHNAVTLFMAQDFLDNRLGVKDPDPLGEMPSPSEAVQMAQCAWKEASDDERAEITKWLLRALNYRRLVSEEVVIPTGQLFMEALPGSHPLLEDYKLQHRRIDVERATADMIKERLEALRYAARVMADELGDPEVQTQVLSGSDAGVQVVVPGGPNPPPP